MTQWYADHAQILLDKRVTRYAKQILGTGHKNIEITYKFLKNRWGLWKPGGSLTFNVELVKSPLQCIDYVIAHELCHLVHPNHDKAFYRLMKRIMPDWKERKERLEIFGIR